MPDAVQSSPVSFNPREYNRLYRQRPEVKARRAAAKKAWKRTEAGKASTSRTTKRWQEKNKERFRAYQKRYREANRPLYLKLKKAWQKKNPSRYASYRAVKNLRGRKPKWADLDAMEVFYKEARRLTAETGVRYEVDHIVPLRNPFVCGLHVEHNLRVITAEQNLKKSNFFWPDQPWGIPWELAGIS